MNKNKTEISNINNLNKVSRQKNVTSPIIQENLVSKVNELTFNSAANQPPLRQNRSYRSDSLSSFDYRYITDKLLKIDNIESINELYNSINSLITNTIGSDFYAIGLFKEQSNCINLRLRDKMGNTYSTKIFMKDKDNPIVQVFTNHKSMFVEKHDYLKLNYYKNTSTVILPLLSANKCIGVFIMEDKHARQDEIIYALIAKYTALVIHNLELTEKSEEFVNTDTLTLLYNHRGFQELLSNEIARSQTTKQQLSVIMMDINNITKINRE